MAVKLASGPINRAKILHTLPLRSIPGPLIRRERITCCVMAEHVGTQCVERSMPIDRTKIKLAAQIAVYSLKVTAGTAELGPR